MHMYIHTLSFTHTHTHTNTHTTTVDPQPMVQGIHLPMGGDSEEIKLYMDVTKTGLISQTPSCPLHMMEVNSAAIHLHIHMLWISLFTIDVSLGFVLCTGIPVLDPNSVPDTSVVLDPSFCLQPVEFVEHLQYKYDVLFNISLHWVSTGFDGSENKGEEDGHFGPGSVFQQPLVFHQHICQS